jgi:hypothetical protein
VKTSSENRSSKWISSTSRASKSSPSSREAQRRRTPRSVSTTTSYSSAPHHSGSGGPSHSSTDAPVPQFGGALRPLRRPTRPHASGRDCDVYTAIGQVQFLPPAVIVDAPHTAAPTEGSIRLGTADVLEWLCRLPERAPSGLAAQEPLADRLNGEAVALVAQGGAHSLVAFGRTAHQVQHLFGFHEHLLRRYALAFRVLAAGRISDSPEPASRCGRGWSVLPACVRELLTSTPRRPSSSAAGCSCHVASLPPNHPVEEHE